MDPRALIELNYERFNSRAFDPESPLLAEDLEVDMSRRPFEPMVMRGRESYFTFLEEFVRDWDEVRFEIAELSQAPGGEWIAFIVAHGRGRTSGAEVKGRVAHGWVIEDGAVKRIRYYDSWEDGREALRQSA